MTITFVPDEWIELKGRVPTNDKPDVSISITFWNLKTNRIAEKGPRTMLFFRREAADWIELNGPRFTVKLNKNLDRIAIVPNPKGLFVGSVNKGAGRVPLGVVLQLPNEQLAPQECEYSLSGNEMMLIDLPSDFASARDKAAASVAKIVPAAPVIAKPIVPSVIKKSTPAIAVCNGKYVLGTGCGFCERCEREAAILKAAGRPVERRVVVESHNFGDPTPGRSALDQKRG